MARLSVRSLIAAVTFTIGLAAAPLSTLWSNLRDIHALRTKKNFLTEQLITTHPLEEEFPSGFDDAYTVNDRLTYGSYEVVRLSQKVKINSKIEREDQYAVLRKNGKQVARFQFDDAAFDTEVRFGLFPVLGGENKQLIVELTTHRVWQYWVVNLYPEFRVLYDSGEYDVGSGLGAVDLDGDGRRELFHTLHTFWFFNQLNNTNSPFIDIIFRYDPATVKFVPANPQFSGFVLKDIDGRILEAREMSRAPKNFGDDLSKVMEVVLRLVYAGREEEAWAFFEREYHQPDKATIKSEIKKKLREDSVYRKLRR